MLNLIPLSFALFAASGDSAGPAPKTASETNSDRTSFVLIENTRKVPIEVFMRTTTGERSLGTVAANAITPIRIDAELTNQREASFYLDPRGQPTEETGPVELEAGKGIEIKVPTRW